MAYDAVLADRVRDVLETVVGVDAASVVERPMFGGLAFVVDDYLALAVSHQGGLLLRVDPDAEQQLRERPHVDDLVMRDRPVRGWLRVEAEGCVRDDDLRRWVEEGVARAHQLPARHDDAARTADG